MKFKLDENFGTRALQLFHAAGYDVQTVREQSLRGCTDRQLYEKCCEEAHCLVTLDLDFADVTRFPPDRAEGIIVFRLPRRPSLSLLKQQVQRVFQALGRTPVDNQLWIVEPDRIRIHQSNGGDEP